MNHYAIQTLYRRSIMWIATNVKSIGRMNNKEIEELDSVLLVSNLFSTSPREAASEVRECLDSFDREAREHEYEIHQYRG